MGSVFFGIFLAAFLVFVFHGLRFILSYSGGSKRFSGAKVVDLKSTKKDAYSSTELIATVEFRDGSVGKYIGEPEYSSLWKLYPQRAKLNYDTSTTIHDLVNFHLYDMSKDPELGSMWHTPNEVRSPRNEQNKEWRDTMERNGFDFSKPNMLVEISDFQEKGLGQFPMPSFTKYEDSKYCHFLSGEKKWILVFNTSLDFNLKMKKWEPRKAYVPNEENENG